MSVYVFERHDVVGAGRGALLEMLRDRWGPHLAERFGLEQAGLWATVGSTGRWPEAWSLTAAPSREAFAEAMDGMYPMEARATYAYEMWRHSLPLRTGGASFVCTLASGDLSGPTYAAYLMELTQTRRGRRADFQTAVTDVLAPLNATRDITLLASFDDALVPTHAITLWGLPDWTEMPMPFTSADGPEALAWFEQLDELAEESYGFVLAPAPKTRLGT